MSAQPGRLGVVDDDPLLLDQLTWALKGRFELFKGADAAQGLALAEHDPDVFLLDLRLPPSNEAEEGLKLVAELHQRRPEASIVVMTGEADRRLAQRAVELGAFDVFRKPFDTAELVLVLTRALERRRLVGENRALREEMLKKRSFGGLVGASAGMRALFSAIGKVAPSDATVLVYGESGTGKELVAEAIHRGSRRAHGPFVVVNSSALPESLAESELFGHERGAFTGAVAARSGRFEMAHRGTLFLDEVATLSPAVQAKLLRVLERREFERVGGSKTISVDIRLIAATNEDLKERAAKGEFREDLYYRLSTVVLTIPPLRERREDLPLLVEHFAGDAARRHGRPAKSFSPEALAVLGTHPFRGNVRELGHLVEMLTLMVEDDVILPAHLPGAVGAPEPPGTAGALPDGLPLAAAVARYEEDLLRRAIEKAGGVKARAAAALGLDANQMKYLCRKYRL
ncbi:MAG TPA: sigma-54 dependent transcriptional regulator [Thermoanaerobaculia bacterium]|nr:sigma-54 dependent transcriptional regulator [Thermoanaerobaculia bacterium]